MLYTPSDFSHVTVCSVAMVKEVVRGWFLKKVGEAFFECESSKTNLFL